MTIQVGEKVPAGSFGIMTEDGPAAISTDELFSDKRVVLFSVPGAFTPTCSAKHLPGFVERAGDFEAKGVDTIACMAVNDTFVMDAWGKDRQVGDTVLMLADGNGDYSAKLGLEMDASGFGMGMRSQRFAMLIDDGVVEVLSVEKPGAFDVSSAESLLEQL